MSKYRNSLLRFQITRYVKFDSNKYAWLFGKGFRSCVTSHTIVPCALVPVLRANVPVQNYGHGMVILYGRTPTHARHFRRDNSQQRISSVDAAIGTNYKYNNWFTKTAGIMSHVCLCKKPRGHIIGARTSGKLIVLVHGWPATSRPTLVSSAHQTPLDLPVDREKRKPTCARFS